MNKSAPKIYRAYNWSGYNRCEKIIEIGRQYTQIVP